MFDVIHYLDHIKLVYSNKTDYLSIPKVTVSPSKSAVAIAAPGGADSLSRFTVRVSTMM